MVRMAAAEKHRAARGTRLQERYQMKSCGCGIFPMKMGTTWVFFFLSLPVGLQVSSSGLFSLPHFGIPDSPTYTYSPSLQPCLPASVSYNVALVYRILLCMPCRPGSPEKLGCLGGSRGPAQAATVLVHPLPLFSGLALAFHLSYPPGEGPASPTLATAQGQGGQGRKRRASRGRTYCCDIRPRGGDGRRCPAPNELPDLVRPPWESRKSLSLWLTWASGLRVYGLLSALLPEIAVELW